MAPGWEQRREWILASTALVNDWLVAQVDPQPGQSILDVAAGTGDLGFAAAERVGPGGRVLCTDFSSEMLAAARRNGERRALSNVEYRILDAERMDLDDDSVDGVLCRWGLMLVADPAAALGETRRVLRDGGTLAFAVWQTPDRNPWAAIPGKVMVERGHVPPPEPGAPGMFALGERNRLAELVREAHFAAARVEEIAFAWHYRGDDLWQSLTQLSGSLAGAIKQLPDEEQQDTRAVIEERMDRFRQDGELIVPAAAWGVVAR